MKMSLMDLVHNHHLIPSQCPVLLDLSKQQPLCQEQQFGGCGSGGLKANLVPHLKIRIAFYELCPKQAFIVSICLHCDAVSMKCSLKTINQKNLKSQFLANSTNVLSGQL